MLGNLHRHRLRQIPRFVDVCLKNVPLENTRALGPQLRHPAALISDASCRMPLLMKKRPHKLANLRGRFSPVLTPSTETCRAVSLTSVCWSQNCGASLNYSGGLRVGARADVG